MKKLFAFLLVAMLAITPALASAELTMGSWRPDDTEKMNNLLAIYKDLTGVEIIYQPTNAPDYNATLRLQLDAGTGPDLIYARSYETGRELSAAGFLGDCSDIPGVMENFAASSLEPWQNADGSMFAVPFAAVSHCVYYNIPIFEEHGIEIPTTWEQFIEVCEKLLAAGVLPLGNGVADEWDILECFFLGMVPNYVGGAAERVLYETGEKKLNDEAFVKCYEDFAQIALYLPDGFGAVTYNDASMLFATGECAMYVDGSWSCGLYEEADFEWGVFAIPAPEGMETRICFHPDFAITYNSASPNAEEAKAFLEWIASPEGAAIASAALPAGFFPMINAPITLEEPHANAILALNEGKELDARFVWPVLMNLYSPMNTAIIQLLRGELTPQEAADAVAALVP